MEENNKIKLFISYSHKDREHCVAMINHLSSLKRNTHMDHWQDGEILPGANWNAVINKHLEEADIVVFLLSADFLASSFIYENEIKKAIEKFNRHEQVLIPVMLRLCDIEDTFFDKIQGLPTGLKPILDWPSPDHGYFNVVKGIKKVVNNLVAKKLEDKNESESNRLGENISALHEKIAHDDLVNEELQNADRYYDAENYEAAFPVYYKYRNHHLFNSEGQLRLGYFFEKGLGTKQDYNDALYFYRKSADLGNSIGQNNLGLMYLFGKGITKNYNEALKWFIKSAEQDNSDGQVNLGYMYEMGYAVEKDFDEAVKWYVKSAKQGNAFGQHNIGNLYLYGLGVNKDYIKARNWIRKSVNQGNLLGQYNLGRIYENGLGVAININKAKEFYKKSAIQGHEEAQQACRRLGLTL